MKIKIEDIFNEKNLKLVEKVVWSGVSITFGIALIKYFNPFSSNKDEKEIEIAPAPQSEENYICTYSDAIESVTSSNMTDSDMKLAIAKINYGAPQEYYKSICYICDSSMTSSGKVTAITSLKDPRDSAENSSI